MGIIKKIKNKHPFFCKHEAAEKLFMSSEWFSNVCVVALRNVEDMHFACIAVQFFYILKKKD